MTTLNDWRYNRYHYGKAHLWALTPGGMWRSACGRAAVLDLIGCTDPLDHAHDPDHRIRKCRVYLPQEQRRKEAA